MLCEYENFLSTLVKTHDGHMLPFPSLEFQDAL